MTPQQIAKQSASRSRLLKRNVASRETTDSSLWSARRSGSRHRIIDTEKAMTTARKPSSQGPMADWTNECTEFTTPLRVRKSPKMASEKAVLTSTMFHTLSMPFFSCTITECRKAVAASQGMSAALSTGSQAQ